MVFEGSGSARSIGLPVVGGVRGGRRDYFAEEAQQTPRNHLDALFCGRPPAE